MNIADGYKTNTPTPSYAHHPFVSALLFGLFHHVIFPTLILQMEWNVYCRLISHFSLNRRYVLMVIILMLAPKPTHWPLCIRILRPYPHPPPISASLFDLCSTIPSPPSISHQHKFQIIQRKNDATLSPLGDDRSLQSISCFVVFLGCLY